MQPLTAAPRDHLTADQVLRLLTDPTLHTAAGLELLDTTNTWISDISDDLQPGGRVTWDNRTPLHGSCNLSLTRELVWGRDRVRPYMDLSDRPVNPTVTARFYLGVYVLTTPDSRRGEDPITWSVTGYDLLSLLQSSGPADTYEVPAGTSYIQAVRDAMTASGVGMPVLLDGAAQDTPLPATMVWAVTKPIPSWLRIITELLAAVGYTAPWADELGQLRARPFVPPDARAVEWTIDTSDPSTDIVDRDRTVSTEAGDIANWWRFVRTNMTTTPIEGDGIYTPAPNQSIGPTSIDALGREVRKFEPLDAADQASLVAQGDRIVAEDMASVTTVHLSIDPLPIMGFEDAFRYVDAGTTSKMIAASWQINLDGSRGSLQLGGAPAEVAGQPEAQVKATVTSAAPLRVVVDGAETDSFANALDAALYQVGDRVTCTVRNPRPPLVQGVES